MLDAIVTRWTNLNRGAPRPIAVVIPSDRPDLLADAGYEGLRYRGPVAHGRHWQAASWMPFHAAAG